MNGPVRIDALLRSAPPFPPARRPHETKSGLMRMQQSDWAELKREAESEAEWRTYCATVREGESDHPALVAERRRTGGQVAHRHGLQQIGTGSVCLLTEAPRVSRAPRGHWRLR